MNFKRLNMLPLAAAVLASFAGTASAVDFHGYFRTGIGWSTESGGQSCFSLPGVPGNGNGRLGNECGSYGELQFDQNLYEGKDQVKFDYHIMLGYFANNQTDFENFSNNGNNLALRQNYLELKNLKTAYGGSLWIGKRYYQRHDVHINDFFYWNNSGPGAGIENIDFGEAGKVSFAVLRANSFYGAVPGNGSVPNDATTILDARWAAIPFGGFGSLEFGLQYNLADSKRPNKDDGFAFNAEHTLPLLGGVNKFFLQYSTGSAGYGAALGNPNNVPGVNAALEKQDGTYAVLDAWQWQAGPDFSGMVAGSYYNFKNNYSWTSLTARPVWHISDYFKLQFEYAYNSVKPDSNNRASATDGTRRLQKITIAPTLAAGRGFWARPELRLYASYNKWNDKARDNWGGVAGGRTGQFGIDTNGTTYGFQAEAWF